MEKEHFQPTVPVRPAALSVQQALQKFMQRVEDNARAGMRALLTDEELLAIGTRTPGPHLKSIDPSDPEPTPQEMVA